MAQANHLGGLQLVMYLSAAFTVFDLWILYRLLRDFVRTPVVEAHMVVVMFWLSLTDFWVQRPQVWALGFFLGGLYGLLVYWHKKRWWGIGLFLLFTWLWSNTHGSIFLAPLLSLGLAIASLIFAKKRQSLVFLTATTIAVIISILPPLGTTQYRMLWLIYQNSALIKNFIDEWAPLSAKPLGFVVYSLGLATSVVVFGWLVVKRKQFGAFSWLWVLSPLLLSGYLASRNVVWGYVVIGLMTGAILSWWKANQWWRYGILAILIAVHFWLFVSPESQVTEFIRYYPTGATQFLLTHPVEGHLYNEYGYGAYLLYHLYPKYQVFFDGRTDLYLCCEIPEQLNLALRKNLPDTQYSQILDSVWANHQISFVLLRTQKNVLSRKIAHILQNNSDWSLVYWDDASEIFVRHDGRNQKIIQDFGVVAATPYDQDLYRTGQELVAMKEYQRMESIQDSAKTRNALGYLMAKQGDLQAAKIQFEQAIKLAYWEESAYMNLGELMAHDGELDQAIGLYRQAIKLAPNRGLGYIRLGQLLVQQGKISDAKSVWSSGIQNTQEDQAREQLNNLLVANY